MLRKLLFNLWYFRDPPWDTGISPPELMAFIESRPPGRALDLGCGTGTNAITLAKHGWQVAGIDIALRAIYQGRRKANRAGVDIDLKVGDVSNPPPFRQPFDLILDIGCFHSLTDPAKTRYAANFPRLLSPEGTYLLYAFYKTSPSEERPGLSQQDLALLDQYLELTQRVNGEDRGSQASAWFTYRPKTA